MDKGECLRLESYLRKMFKVDTIEVRRRPNKTDSAEVYLVDEFIGIMFEDDDDDDDDKSYSFQMSILGFDLEGH